MQLNKVTLVGELNDDPQLRKDSEGIPFGLLSLGTNESWTDQSGKKNTIAAWHRVRVLNREILRTVTAHLKKGSRVLVEGSLQYARTQQPDGDDIVVPEVVILPKKGALYLMESVNHKASTWRSNKTSSLLVYAACFLIISTFASPDLFSATGELLLADVWTKLESTLTGGLIKIGALVALTMTCIVGAKDGNWTKAAVSGGMLGAGVCAQTWINSSFTMCI